MAEVFPYPVARVGILGGGQLGRMLALAARRLGCACVVLDPQAQAPAGQVADRQIVGAYDDPDRLAELAAASDVITFELEHVETAPLEALEAAGHRIRPRPRLIALIQDKYRQKVFLRQAGIPTPPFEDLPAPSREAFAAFGYPLVQKARRGGYDGRGVVVMEGEEDYPRHLPVPGYLERYVEAALELGVLVARNGRGETRVYPPVEMAFRPRDNVLDRLVSPARVDARVAERARRLALETVTALDGVGVFGIELFLTRDGELLVNEIAPRTHNSGHHTLEANLTDQFEQHLRAILDLPLGDTRPLSPAVMVNLLGEAGHRGRPRIAGLDEALAIPGVCVHLYGKAETRPGRKMGHVTILDERLEDALAKADRVQETLKILGEQT